MLNQNPEKIARNQIDQQLLACGWIILDIKKVNLHADTKVTIREYPMYANPAGYMLLCECNNKIYVPGKYIQTVIVQLENTKRIILNDKKA